MAKSDEKSPTKQPKEILVLLGEGEFGHEKGRKNWREIGGRVLGFGLNKHQVR